MEALRCVSAAATAEAAEAAASSADFAAMDVSSHWFAEDEGPDEVEPGEAEGSTRNRIARWHHEAHLALEPLHGNAAWRAPFSKSAMSG